MKTIIFIVYFICMLALGYLLYHQNKIIEGYENYQYDKQIDSLQHLIDTMKLDTVFIHKHELQRDSIKQEIAQEWIDMSKFSDAEHIQFFSNYIEEYTKNH